MEDFLGLAVGWFEYLQTHPEISQPIAIAMIVAVPTLLFFYGFSRRHGMW